MANLATIAYPITAKSEEKLTQYIKDLITQRTNLSALHTKLELCDRYISREPKKGEKRMEVTVPIIMPQCDTMVAYLTSIFLNTPSIFPVTTAPAATEIADSVNALFKNFAKDWKWKRELLLCFKDASKYDLMVAEVGWKENKVGTVSTDSIQVPETGKSRRLGEKKTKEGFSIKHLDPYNAFWDMSVPPAELAEFGEFAGYFEQKTDLQLHRLLLSLPVNNGYNHRIKELKESQCSQRNFFCPKITTYDSTTQVTNWHEHFSNLMGVGGTSNLHEVTTCYLRIIPSEFDMKVPASGTPQIWKFVVVDYKFVVYAECRSNAHDYLPIIVGQPFESNIGYQQKSLPEELASLQNLASNLMSMEVESNRRTVSNREVYNPLLIRKEDINNPSSTAKIPLRNSAYGQDISKAIFSIPYNDPALGTRSNLAQGIMQFASLVTGQNQVSNGQFVKGNKTNDQFNEVLSRSDARQVAMAVLLEDQFFGVLKHILLFDLLQYQQPVKVFDEDSNAEIDVEPEKFLDTNIQFTINDSLSIGEDNISPEVVMTMLQTIQSVEQLSMDYDIGKVFAFLASKSGLKNLQDFRRQQQPQPQQAAQPQPQVQGQQGTQLTPEQAAQAANSPINEQDYNAQMQQALTAQGETTTPEEATLNQGVPSGS